jgi:hypothetical protein
MLRGRYSFVGFALLLLCTFGCDRNALVTEPGNSEESTTTATNQIWRGLVALDSSLHDFGEAKRNLCNSL